jgi:hypothetical protein
VLAAPRTVAVSGWHRFSTPTYRNRRGEDLHAMDNSDITLNGLLLRITVWAEMQARLVLESGQPLDERGIQLAARAGIQHPEEVLLLAVSEIPTSAEADLKRALEQFSIAGPNTAGLTIGYSILLRADSVTEAQLAHQLKRVAQFERCEGIPSFFEKYVSEVNEYGCAAAPLELEAVEFAADHLLA